MSTGILHNALIAAVCENSSDFLKKIFVEYRDYL